LGGRRLAGSKLRFTDRPLVSEHDGTNGARVPLRPTVGRGDALSVELTRDGRPAGAGSVSLGDTGDDLG
jgi:hypothetical protein